ncbi:PAS domain-containing hybrid sensor histidine kinase/response regulator [Desulfosporosinus fructosivorans]|uniref:Stage 0 sporulation protein A homolog n=1 Tax=Desulfosporosinus fructosivorans TaxID=2018669 RepID=A0A4Z0QZX2_9FIRM|nr:ATP-binding protein [Desulfosporosinus fructosivorans]TGE36342.1 PAS domain-containing hybrid sensor histidine kinase/response regulator [Desulfosporosinus fructosivorans]
MDLYVQVQKAFSRLENLSQCDLSSQELTSKLLSELDFALHELKIASVELIEQNEEMASSRQKLEAERCRYQELFDFAPDGYLVTDTEGIILDANIAATTLFNLSRSLLMGKPLAIFVRSDEHLIFRTRLLEIKKGIVIQNENWELIMLSGKRTTFPVSITVGKVIASSGGKEELRWLLRDISKRKQLEEELQKADKLESLGVLAGGIAHDLNNFLTVILGNLSLVKRCTKEEPKATKYLQYMEEAVKQTGNLTRQMLTFAKGGQPLTKAVSLYRLIEDDSAFALSGSKTRCELFFTEDLPSVEIDRGQMTQVITNILINADQAMLLGGTIKIHAKELAVTGENSTLPLQIGNYVALTITDEGAGISSQILPKIFDPYFSTKDLGSGLGLTICYAIVKKHGGHISVQSVEGQGTSFTIYLPVSNVQAEKEVHEDILILGEGKVLLMDDEESVRQTANEMLTFLGYDVELAGDGAQAVRLYKEAFLSGRPYDVVITDLTVRGGMGGKVAVSELLIVDPDVKAIVSSGYSADALITDYKNYGFCDVIAKPYRIQELGKVMSSVMQRSRKIK